MAKYLFFDTETTGLDPVNNGIHQIGGAIIVTDILNKDCTSIEEFNLYANPFGSGLELSEWREKDGTVKNALQVSGVTREQVEAYPSYAASFFTLIDIFDRQVSKYDKDDKFVCVGYNIKFDCDMLRGWANHLGFKYINSYLSYQTIDVMDLARLADAIGALPSKPKDHKLETMCELLNIEIKAHDALSDILATKELMFKLLDLIKESK